MSKLLINEPPLQVLPSLAIKIGLNESIVLQQLHYLLREPRHGKKIGEHLWIFNTIEEWCSNYFPFWSGRTLKRVFSNLRRMNLIATCQPEGRISRRQYYRVNIEAVDAIAEGDKLASSMGPELPDGKVPKLPIPSTKTSYKEDENRDADCETTGKSRNGFPIDPKVNRLHSKPPLSKKGKLAALPAPPGHPTEEAFDDFLHHQQLESVIRMRPDLFHDLCETKWHRWNSKLQKWTPVYDWQKMLLGLEEHLHANSHLR